MLTIFAIPKPFHGEIKDIQRNAIKSWTLLSPKCEVILFGDDEGIAETAAEFGILHIPEVRTTKAGTPLINDVFEKAQKIAKNKILAYVNSDIILMEDFMRTVERVSNIKEPNFLMVGQRSDLDLKERLEFNDDWENKLRLKVKKEGKLHHPDGADYFVFSSDTWGKIMQDRTDDELLPLAIGRDGVDSWVLYRTRLLGIPLIDVTPVVTIVHQNHFSRKLNDFQEKIEVYKKIRRIEKFYCPFIIRDANWIFTSSGLKKAPFTIYRFYRYYETLPIEYPRFGLLLKVLLFPGKLVMIIIRRTQCFLKFQCKKSLDK
ncbi:MAG: hypothetical protein ABIA08_02550 [bacterium]